MNKINIGIDCRTFSYANSVSRGIGHYTINHLQNIIEIEKNWNFILYSEESLSNDIQLQFKKYNNVEFKRFVDYNEGEIDLFHIPDPMNTSIGFDSPLRMIHNLPTTILFHDLIPLYFYYDGWTQQIRDIYDLRLEQIVKSGCTVLTNSNFTKQDLINYLPELGGRTSSVWAGINSAQILTSLNSADSKNILNKFNIDLPYFLHVGALDGHKNIESVLKSFLLFNKNNQAKLVIVGKKDANFRNLEKIIIKQNIKNVIFTDYVSREELNILYKNAIALLFLSKYEGFGFPALEAMANECPVITTNEASLPEVVGDAALRVGPEEIVLVAESMKKLFDNDELRLRMRNLGKERSKLFSWEKTALETTKVWRHLLQIDPKKQFEKYFDETSIFNFNLKQSISSEITSSLNVVWQSPIFDSSGYADEARNIILGLNEQEVKIKAIPSEWNESKALIKNDDNHKLVSLCSTYFKNLNVRFAHISQNFPKNFQFNKRAYLNIGRTMFETDSIPNEWVKFCNQMDEIWVPSDFNIKTFGDAGVEKTKLRKVHEPLDTNNFHLNVKPLEELKSIKGFKFLSVFDWSLRKGWDVLIESFVKEFGNNSKVSLILKTWSSSGKNFSEIQLEIEKSLRDKLSVNKIPGNIIFFNKNLSTSELPRLYKSVDAYVSASRGEGWGRPMMEAMAMGLPTIATRYGGQLEFMNDDNSFLIENEIVEVSRDAYEETPLFKGHKWSEPSVSHLQKIMKIVVKDKNLAKSKGLLARNNIVKNFSREKIAKDIIQILNDKLAYDEKGKTKVYEEQKKHSVNPKKIIVNWEGEFDKKSSLGIINNELRTSLNRKSDLKIVKLDKAKQNVNADVNVYHQFPPNLSPPSTGKWIVIQPWEFGSVPKKWIEAYSNKLDELWVPTSFVKNCFVESGFEESRICVIPNGFDPQIFNKNVRKYNLKTKKKFKFLFVGGTIYRKGIDILLKSYTTSFSKSDDVCLVIKDMGGSSFYSGQNAKVEIEKLKSRKNAPEIEYVEEFLSEDEIAGLYNTCDVLVHPYRGEGFGMPILEAMACGLPVMLTNGGACLDFCNSNNSILIAAEKTYYKVKKVGNDETVNYPWMFEVLNGDLSKNMRSAYGGELQLDQLADTAYKYVHENLTWDNIAELVGGRIKHLSKSQPIRENETKKIDVETTLNKIDSLFSEQKFEETILLINKLIDENKKSEQNFSDDIINNLLCISGYSYLHLSQLENAHLAFESALKLVPNSSQACFGLSEVFKNAEMLEESKTMLEWAIVNDINNTNAKIRLSEVNKKLNLPEDHNSLVEENKMVKE